VLRDLPAPEVDGVSGESSGGEDEGAYGDADSVIVLSDSENGAAESDASFCSVAAPRRLLQVM